MNQSFSYRKILKYEKKILKICFNFVDSFLVPSKSISSIGWHNFSIWVPIQINDIPIELMHFMSLKKILKLTAKIKVKQAHLKLDAFWLVSL